MFSSENDGTPNFGYYFKIEFSNERAAANKTLTLRQTDLFGHLPNLSIRAPLAKPAINGVVYTCTFDLKIQLARSYVACAALANRAIYLLFVTVLR